VITAAAKSGVVKQKLEEVKTFCEDKQNLCSSLIQQFQRSETARNDLEEGISRVDLPTPRWKMTKLLAESKRQIDMGYY